MTSQVILGLLTQAFAWPRLFVPVQLFILFDLRQRALTTHLLGLDTQKMYLLVFSFSFLCQQYAPWRSPSHSPAFKRWREKSALSSYSVCRKRGGSVVHCQGSLHCSWWKCVTCYCAKGLYVVHDLRACSISGSMTVLFCNWLVIRDAQISGLFFCLNQHMPALKQSFVLEDPNRL